MENIKLFPNIEDVFEDLSAFHEAIFFPVLSVELSSIGKGNGKVHFVTVYGNGDPDVEISGTDFGCNFVKFKIIGDKYRFDGDLRQIPNIDKTLEWYEEAEVIYGEHKSKYLTNTEFTKTEDEKREKIDFDYYFYIKGVINYWVTKDKYLETGKFIQGGAYSSGDSDHEREPFETIGGVYDDEFGLEYLVQVLDDLKIGFNDLDFVGSVTGYNYSELGEDEILLFINNEKTEAFQYFRWS